MSKHTKGTWKTSLQGGMVITYLQEEGAPTFVAECRKETDRKATDTEKANAAHIVRCVKAHDALVEALTDMVHQAERSFWDRNEETTPAYKAARAALALAKGE